MYVRGYEYGRRMPLHFLESDLAHPHYVLCLQPQFYVGQSHHWTALILDSKSYPEYQLVTKKNRVSVGVYFQCLLPADKYFTWKPISFLF